MKTLKEWTNEHFWDNAKPVVIVDDDGKELDIRKEEYENYEFVKSKETTDENIVTVRQLTAVLPAIRGERGKYENT